MKLVIAEKPSVAAELAKVLNAANKKNGYYVGQDFYITWCVGHLIETCMPESYDPKYAKWKITELPILPEEWKYEVTASTSSQYEIVRRLMEREDVDELICATDAGREGELIFRLVYHQAGCTKPFRRLWISSMETKAIKDGFDSLKAGSDYDRLYQASVSRMQADWLVGINFSRLFSCMSDQPQNVGRVQTPTVNLIVERQRAIDNFNAKPYYILTAACIRDGVAFAVTKRVETAEESKAILEKCSGKDGQVTGMKNTPMKENPPPLYDLTTLQREANKLLGLSAQQTLDAAQNLYEKKRITYPRTDSRYLTADMEKNTELLIGKLASEAPYVSDDTKKGYMPANVSMDRLVNDKKVTDHHAIIPTAEALRDLDKLQVNEANLLIMITYKLLAAAYISHEYRKTELSVAIEGEEFKATGRIVTVPGFKELTAQMMPLLIRPASAAKKKSASREKKEEEAVLPPLTEGDVIEEPALSAERKETKPPKPYTEDTLLSAMENAMKTLEDEALKKDVAGAGLGTPATRAGIIERIIKTGFVERKGKQLLPTEKAYRIVDIVPDKVKSAVLTAEWEQKLEQIYKGQAGSEAFMEDIRSFVSDLVAGYREGCDFDEDGREIMGICPRCGANIYEGRSQYYCGAGRDKCGFTIWKDDKFFTSKNKPLTKPMVKALLRRGRIKCVNLYSEKKDVTYDAYVRMVDTGQYVNFRVEF